MKVLITGANGFVAKNLIQYLSEKENIEILKTYLEENLREKENDPEIPKTGMAVLQQQIVLADAIEKWIISLKKDF